MMVEKKEKLKAKLKKFAIVNLMLALGKSLQVIVLIPDLPLAKVEELQT